MIKRALAAMAALTLLAACGQGSEVQPKADAEQAPAVGERYVNSLDEDVAGNYVPLEAIQFQNWRLKHIFIGGPHTFKAWMDGAHASAGAPATFVFEDMQSPSADLASPEGGRTLTVVAAAFDISKDRISIDAVSGGVGVVRFEGRLDLNALDTSRRNLGHEGAVLTGQLKIGHQTFDNVRLKWWTGG